MEKPVPTWKQRAHPKGETVGIRIIPRSEENQNRIAPGSQLLKSSFSVECKGRRFVYGTLGFAGLLRSCLYIQAVEDLPEIHPFWHKGLGRKDILLRKKRSGQFYNTRILWKRVCCIKLFRHQSWKCTRNMVQSLLDSLFQRFHKEEIGTPVFSTIPL